jgi:hypothetical protein
VPLGAGKNSLISQGHLGTVQKKAARCKKRTDPVGPVLFRLRYFALALRYFEWHGTQRGFLSAPTMIDIIP